MESLAKSSVCPSGQLFELELNTGNEGYRTNWDLIGSKADNTIERVLNGPETTSGYGDNMKYYYSACLDPERYRFQMRNSDGTYKLSYGGEVIYNSKSSQNTGNIFSYRFRVTSNGYVPLSRNRGVATSGMNVTSSSNSESV